MDNNFTTELCQLFNKRPSVHIKCAIIYACSPTPLIDYSVFHNALLCNCCNKKKKKCNETIMTQGPSSAVLRYIHEFKWLLITRDDILIFVLSKYSNCFVCLQSCCDFLANRFSQTQISCILYWCLFSQSLLKIAATVVQSVHSSLLVSIIKYALQYYSDNCKIAN